MREKWLVVVYYQRAPEYAIVCWHEEYTGTELSCTVAALAQFSVEMQGNQIAFVKAKRLEVPMAIAR